MPIFNHEDFVVLMFQDHAFGCATDEIRLDAIEGNPISFNANASLACGNEFGVMSPLVQGAAQFNRGHHLANAAIVTDGVDAEALLT